MTQTLLFDPDTGLTQASHYATLSSEWAEQLETVMQRDRDFFRQHPECDYYIRPITDVEVLEGQAMGTIVDETARVLVGEIVPGSRVRLTILDDLPPPVEEFRATLQQQRHQRGGKSATLKERIQYNQNSRPKPKGFGTKA